MGKNPKTIDLSIEYKERRGFEPRAPLRTTRFPSVRTRPLCDLSIDKEIDGNTNLFSLSCFTEKILLEFCFNTVNHLTLTRKLFFIFGHHVVFKVTRMQVKPNLFQSHAVLGEAS